MINPFRKRKVAKTRQSAQQVLRDARAIIVNEGWQQSGLGGPQGPSCALGAVSQAVDPGQDCLNYPKALACRTPSLAPVIHEAVYALARTAPEPPVREEPDTLGEAERVVYRSNDYLARKEFEILNWFDRAAEEVAA